MTSVKSIVFTVYNTVVLSMSLKQLPERAHHLGVALSLLYTLDLNGLSEFSSLCGTHPQIFTVFINAILDAGKAKPLAVFALRLLFFALQTQDTAEIFCKDNYHFLEQLIKLSNNEQADENVSQLQAVTAGFSPTTWDGAESFDSSLLTTLQDPLLSATLISVRYVLDANSSYGSDLVSDASSAVLAHLALISPLARRILMSSPCNGLLAHSLSNASFLELVTPSRLIHLISVFLYLLSADLTLETFTQIKELVYKYNLKNIAIKLGNLVFLNNLHWHLLYQHPTAHIKKAGSGIYTLENKQIIFDSDDLFLLKQQLVRLLRALF